MRFITYLTILNEPLFNNTYYVGRDHYPKSVATGEKDFSKKDQNSFSVR